jgi:hypothetical protein
MARTMCAASFAGGSPWSSISFANGGNGVAFDGGLGMDIRLAFIAFGGHVGYATIDAQPSAPQWVILGLDAAIIF